MQLLQKHMPLKWVVYAFITSLGVYGARAQYTITKFLETTNSSSIVVSDSTNLLKLQDINYSLPFFDGIELRTETRDLLLERQEYAVRFKPNPIKAISKQKNLFNSKLEQVKISNKLNFNRELKTRYHAILDYIFIEKEIALQLKRKKQLEDALRLYQESIYETNFNVKDLIKAEEEFLDIKMQIDLLYDQLSNYKQSIGELSNSSIKTSNTVNTDEFITPQQIIDSPIDIVDNDEALKITFKKLELQTLDDEINLDIAKSRQLIDFIQAKYGGKNSVFFDENFSIGLGINLPFLGKNKKKKGDYYFDKLNEESLLAVLKQEEITNKQEALQRYNRDIASYKIQDEQTQESSVKSLLKTYKKIDGVSPLILLELEILVLKKEINALNLQATMYHSYIDMLAAYQILFKEPYINYLSSRFQTLSF